jgi:hypothetical protein
MTYKLLPNGSWRELTHNEQVERQTMDKEIGLALRIIERMDKKPGRCSSSRPAPSHTRCSGSLGVIENGCGRRRGTKRRCGNSRCGNRRPVRLRGHA